MFKRLSGSTAGRELFCWLMSNYMRLVRFSGCWRIVGGEKASQLAESGQPLIVVFWHGRMMMTPFGWRHSNRVHVLSSAHRDGLIASRTMGHFGVRPVFGSTKRGGAGALLRLGKILRDGDIVAIAPDGPRGPRMRASAGAIHLARLAGAKIIPLTFSARPGPSFSSWDRFMLPLPFCRGVILWGTPMEVARDADTATLETCRQLLEQSLTDLTHRADHMMGQDATEAAPAEERFGC